MSIPANAVCFFKDGDKWLCVNGDFDNLQESPVGFGDTFEQALLNLAGSRGASLTNGEFGSAEQIAEDILHDVTR